MRPAPLGPRALLAPYRHQLQVLLHLLDHGLQIAVVAFLLDHFRFQLSLQCSHPGTEKTRLRSPTQLVVRMRRRGHSVGRAADYREASDPWPCRSQQARPAGARRPGLSFRSEHEERV